jgi:hypothetical protein
MNEKNILNIFLEIVIRELDNGVFKRTLIRV